MSTLLILNFLVAQIEHESERKIKNDIEETNLEKKLEINNNNNINEVMEEILSLPIPKDSPISDDVIHSFKLGETLKLDYLGPMIVNSDGIYLFLPFH
jgi:hypothetical protein